MLLYGASPPKHTHEEQPNKPIRHDAADHEGNCQDTEKGVVAGEPKHKYPTHKSEDTSSWIFST